MAAEVSARAAEAARIEGAVAAQIEQATQSLRSGDLERARATLEQAQDNLPRGSLALKEGIHRLRNDLDMVLRLEDVLKLESFTAGKHENSAADSAYLAAFQTYDLDLPRLDPAEAAARVKASKIQSALVTALDDWLFVKPRTDITGRERLLAVVKLADSDPWRQQLRDPATQKDRGTLERLARDGQVAKQPPSLLVHLGKHLAQVGASDSSVNLLRRAQGIYPNDYWVNYALAVALAERKPSRPVNAAGFARAAAALRPQSRLAHYILGRELAALDQASEAEIHFRRADELASSREPRCAAILAADAVQEMTRTDYARAASLLKVSIDMLPRNDAGRKQLAMALTEVERWRGWKRGSRRSCAVSTCRPTLRKRRFSPRFACGELLAMRLRPRVYIPRHSPPIVGCSTTWPIHPATTRPAPRYWPPPGKARTRRTWTPRRGPHGESGRSDGCVATWPFGPDRLELLRCKSTFV